MINKFIKLIVISYLLYSCSPDLPLVLPINSKPTNEFHPGKFVWRDLMTDDIPAVKEFYSELFGWTFIEIGEGKDDYTVVLQDDIPIAGMFNLRDVKEEHKYSQWISYVSVPDMSQVINYTKQSGGTIYRDAFELPNRGKVAFILDSQNAVLAFVKSSSGDPKDTEPKYNGWLWSELWTNEIDNSTKFYTELLGYNDKKYETTGESFYYVFEKEDKPRAGMVKIPFEDVKPHWMPYIAVKDPATVVNKVEQLGGIIYLGTEGIIGNNAAIIADPSGAVFTIQKWPLDEGKLKEVDDE